MFNIGKMKKEELVRELCIKWGLNTLMGNVLAVEIWNAAIDMAAESATIEATGRYNTSFEVDKHSILNLKFDKDEK